MIISGIHHRRKIDRPANWPAATCAVLVVLALARCSAAADTVRYLPAGGTTEAKISGEVLDFTGRQLRLRLPNGRIRELDSSRVAGVTTDWDDACQRGDAQFAEGDFAAALTSYRASLKVEQRVWAQRRILARVIWCLRYENQTPLAIDSFLTLYRSDPTTQFFPAIPLAWTTEPPNPGSTQQLETWLQDGPAVARLIAASWLLPTANRSAAVRSLQGLDDPDPRVVFLSRAQLWRSRVGIAGGDELQEWQRQIERMPREIQAGPYFTLGTAWSQAAQPAAAALAWLRLPILFPAERDLAAQGLLSAAQELESLEQHDPVQPLYLEILRDFAGSPAATEAQRRLNKR